MVPKLGSILHPVVGVVVVDVQLLSSRHLSCQGSHFGNTEEQQLCESHRFGRRGTGHVGAGLCWFFFFLVAYTRTPDDLDDRNYGRKNHCNGTPVFDGPSAHRCGKLHICYRCPSPFAAVVVGVAPFAASFYLFFLDLYELSLARDCWSLFSSLGFVFDAVVAATVCWGGGFVFTVAGSALAVAAAAAGGAVVAVETALIVEFCVGFFHTSSNFSLLISGGANFKSGCLHTLISSFCISFCNVSTDEPIRNVIAGVRPLLALF